MDLGNKVDEKKNDKEKTKKYRLFNQPCGNARIFY